MTVRVVRQAAEACAIEFDTTAQAILSQSKSPRISAARAGAYWIVKRVTNATLPAVGMWFGRDHTTVLRGLGSAELRRLDADYAAKVDRAMARVMAWRNEPKQP